MELTVHFSSRINWFIYLLLMIIKKQKIKPGGSICTSQYPLFFFVIYPAIYIFIHTQTHT